MSHHLVERDSKEILIGFIHNEIQNLLVKSIFWLKMHLFYVLPRYRALVGKGNLLRYCPNQETGGQPTLRLKDTKIEYANSYNLKEIFTIYNVTI